MTGYVLNVVKIFFLLIVWKMIVSLKTIDNLNLSNKISLMDLQNRIFNPFDLSVECDKYLTDIDPDKNYFKDTLGDYPNSEYYLEDTFKSNVGSVYHNFFQCYI